MKNIWKKIEKNVKKETQKIANVVDEGLRKLDDELDNPSHLTSSIPQKKEEAEVRFGFKEEKEQPVNEQPTIVETIVIESSNDKQDVINIQPIAVNQPKNITELAEKYNVPFKGNLFNLKAQAGCPGIMDPLGETPVIEFNWVFNGGDKLHRYNQFKAALELLENFGQESFKEEYLKLSVFGRAMLVHIASVQKVTLYDEKVMSYDEILQTIAPYASEGLNLQEVPFGKNHGINVQRIFDQYVGDKTSNYLEDQQDIELEQAIKLSLEESKLSELKITENDNQTQFIEPSQKEFSQIEVAKKALVNLNKYDIEYDMKSGFEGITFLLETVGIESAKEVAIKNPLLRAAIKEITKISSELTEKMQNLLDEVILILEKDLVKDIALGAVYKSHTMDKLNPVIARINEINKLKDSNAYQITILEENRDVNTIDMDIFNFGVNSKFCDPILKMAGVIQIQDLLQNKGFHAVGTIVDICNSQVNQFDHEHNADIGIISQGTVEHLGATPENTESTEKNDYLG